MWRGKEDRNKTNWKSGNEEQITGIQKRIQNRRNQNQEEMRYKEIIGNIGTGGNKSGRNQMGPNYSPLMTEPMKLSTITS